MRPKPAPGGEESRSHHDSGAAEGNAKDAPLPLKFTEGWAIGKPDTILEMPVDFEIPAQGVMDYQWILIPSFKEDRWIQAFEVRPGNRAIVHHVAAFWRRPGSPWMADAKPGVPIPKPSSAPETGAADVSRPRTGCGTAHPRER